MERKRRRKGKGDESREWAKRALAPRMEGEEKGKENTVCVTVYSSLDTPGRGKEEKKKKRKGGKRRIIATRGKMQRVG